MASTSSSTGAPQGLCSFSRASMPRAPASAAVPRLAGGGLRVRFCAAAKPPEPEVPGGEWRRRRAPPGVDTRIHWENEDEGWVGGDTSKSDSSSKADHGNLLGDKFADLLNESTDSHYQFLGVSPEADLEEIKSVYRRLSKEYHPDTTTLPLKAASAKFMRLREVYNVLSNDESRRFYDWTLAQEVASRQAEKLRMKFEDPYEQEIENYVPIPDVIDRLDGKNMQLSDQAISALTVDVLIVVFAVYCIVYVVLFKEPYD